MAGTVKTAKEIKRAITFREGGYSIAAISHKTGISPSTLNRHFDKHGVGKGTLTTKAINEAKKELLNDAGFASDLKHQIASSIVDDLAQSQSIRAAIALSLEQLVNDTEEPASVKSRSLSALATATKITQEVQRKALDIDGYNKQSELETLPTLSISKMTDEDIRVIIKKANTITDEIIFGDE